MPGFRRKPVKRLFGRPGVVIESFDMPRAVRTRVTTLAVLRSPHYVTGDTIRAFKAAYEKNSRRHRVLGGWVNDDNTVDIVLAYSGKREEDLGQIRRWLERRILNWYSLDPGVYTLRYWNDPERPAST
ncbi:hypothetical protein SEA_ABIGAIL_58 [Microbacterium phage Abigail]|uniref:hypothetical protein n=1 Tax=Microbacterium phage DickRichards TaxID=2776866 RepID=UPI0018A5DB99|nr:hypothetical protein QDW35_gp57 [Microbacterium phage DickRichards]YP_010753416.1 hypothetical protein QDW37_gp58 [Microbacterium phage Abigail]QOP66374.1 hypothetical protein SEA_DICKRICHARDS_57 [Microbacterium phage DickRichards]QXN73558.1 hypothetical protein SEA_ABIGAIL_58 [Microbacterium phage Abigail]